VLKKPLEEPVFAAIKACSGGLLEVTRGGVNYVAYVANFDYVGWKGAVLLPRDAVQEEARSIVRNILLISVIAALVMICLAAAQATFITRPIYRLMGRLHRVTEKDFSAFDNVPVEKLPEIRDLNTSTVAMIEQIRGLIQSSEQKAQEAQEQSGKARQALALAEEAQNEAARALTWLGCRGSSAPAPSPDTSVRSTLRMPFLAVMYWAVPPTISLTVST